MIVFYHPINDSVALLYIGVTIILFAPTQFAYLILLQVHWDTSLWLIIPIKITLSTIRTGELFHHFHCYLSVSSIFASCKLNGPRVLVYTAHVIVRRPIRGNVHTQTVYSCGQLQSACLMCSLLRRVSVLRIQRSLHGNKNIFIFEFR